MTSSAAGPLAGSPEAGGQEDVRGLGVAMLRRHVATGERRHAIGGVAREMDRRDGLRAGEVAAGFTLGASEPVARPLDAP